jgi:hypothetical protein
LEWVDEDGHDDGVRDLVRVMDEGAMPVVQRAHRGDERYSAASATQGGHRQHQVLSRSRQDRARLLWGS